MRLKIVFSTEGKLDIPINYNNILQAIILKHLPKEMARFYHDDGYSLGKRRFKLYTFSNLLGEYNIYRHDNRYRISFFNNVNFYISSPFSDFIREMGDRFLESKKITIGNTNFPVLSVNMILDPKFDEKIKIETISPITIYSTFTTSDNKKKTYYYSPHDTDYSKIIGANLNHKYKSVYNKDINFDSFSITQANTPKKEIKRYKGFIIEAYSGEFILKGDSKLLKMGYDAGLGGKNSQGFGCFRIINI